MSEVAPPNPWAEPPGPDRRSLIRARGAAVSPDDFTPEEWIEIETEAPGTRAVLEAMLREVEDRRVTTAPVVRVATTKVPSVCSDRRDPGCDGPPASRVGDVATAGRGGQGGSGPDD